MLLKLDQLTEIGRFATLRHKAPQFPRLALVYARNAHGKSTICAVLRSAATNSPSMMEARKRLGSQAASKARIHWKSGEVSFNAGRWNECPGPVHVFDQDFVERNVHLGGSVTRAHKRQLLEVVIGEAGIKLAREIERLDAEAKQLGSEQATSSRTIQMAHKAVTNVESYSAHPVPEDIQERVDVRHRALQLANRAAAVAKRPGLQKIEVGSVETYRALLRSSLGGISASAAQQVSAHIQKHDMEGTGLRWLKFGVDHTISSECPFCTQDTSSVEFASALKGFFSDAYTQHVQRIEEAQRALQAIMGPDEETFQASLDRLLEDVRFWSEVCELPVKPSLSEEDRATIADCLLVLSGALIRKTALPLETIELGESLDGVRRAFEILASFNSDVDRCAAAIAQARRDAETADVPKATHQYELHKAWQAKLVEPMKSETEDFNRREGRKAEIAKAKAALQSQLKTYVAETVTGRQADINRLLRRFGANFAIAETKASFVGRDANTEYSVVIGRHTLKAGEERENEPSFKTVLSAGDKFTLALAFFLTQVRADPRIDESVVVLDDPFSSQDMQRQFETASEIRSLARTTCQVLVLSHDPRFLHLIEKDVEDGSCSTYQIVLDGEADAEIRVWSSAKELESLYVRQAERIRHNADTGNYLKDCSPESLAKDIRPFMEDFLKLRYPGRFGPLDMLDGMATAIDLAGANDPLHKDVDDLKALNVYTRQFMHGGAAAPDPDQLRAQCCRVIDVIGRY